MIELIRWRVRIYNASRFQLKEFVPLDIIDIPENRKTVDTHLLCVKSKRDLVVVIIIVLLTVPAGVG